MDEKILKYLSAKERRVLDSLERQQRLELVPLFDKGLEENVQRMLNILEGKGYLDQNVTYRRLCFEGRLRNGVKNMANFVHTDSYEWPLCIIQNAQQYKRPASVFMYFRFHHERKELFLSSLMTLEGLNTSFYPIGEENEVPHISNLKDIGSRWQDIKYRRDNQQTVKKRQQQNGL